MNKKIRGIRGILFGQLFLGQLNLANYFMKIRLDLECLKIYLANQFLPILIPGVTILVIPGQKLSCRDQLQQMSLNPFLLILNPLCDLSQQKSNGNPFCGLLAQFLKGRSRK